MYVLELALVSSLAFCPKGEVCLDEPNVPVLEAPQLCEDIVDHYESALTLRAVQIDYLDAVVERVKATADRKQRIWIGVITILSAGLTASIGWALAEREKP